MNEHIIKGSDIERDTLTLCGKRCDTRGFILYPYSMRKRATCSACIEKAERIERMREGLTRASGKGE